MIRQQEYFNENLEKEPFLLSDIGTETIKFYEIALITNCQIP